MSNKNILLVQVVALSLSFVPFVSSAQSAEDLVGAVASTGTTTTAVSPEVFCAHITDFGGTVRTDAAMKAAEHRADMDRLALMRDEEKQKVSSERVLQRAKEDSARDALLAILREQATSTEQLAVIDDFASTSDRILGTLRTRSDKAREEYAKVTRNDSLIERATRNRALDSYIDNLDAVNMKAQEECAKGIKDSDVLAKYNSMLLKAKSELAKGLKTKKTTLEQRARDVHTAELARLDREYRAGMQAALSKLISVFPDFFNSLISPTITPVAPSATSTPMVPSATSTPMASPASSTVSQ